MPLARWKDLVIDANRPQPVSAFWADALDLRAEALDDGDYVLRGHRPEQTVWVNTVPEPKTVKNRVHLDVNCASLEDLYALGATKIEQPAPDLPWTVLADPEGGEFCAFVRDAADLSPYRLFELVIDSADPHRIAAWWAEVFGVELEGREDKGWWWIQNVPGMPYASWDFVPVPEPKTAKNRVHWDVLVDSVDDLVGAGATLLREPTDADKWSIMADPEGNEFCAFVRKS
jgi:predicted enzyme related to lactoylglutathione lyase